jgi:hypothetical protein
MKGADIDKPVEEPSYGDGVGGGASFHGVDHRRATFGEAEHTQW